MQTIYVCGDSFSSIDVEYPFHWSQKLLYRTINLSRSAASNFQIALQVQQAIKENPSFIIVNFTDPLRIDVRIKPRHGTERIVALRKCRAAIEIDAFKYGTNVLSEFLDHDGVDQTDKSFTSFPIEMVDSPEQYTGTLNYNTNDKHDVLGYYLRYNHVILQFMQNYFYIHSALSMLKLSGIPFTYNLGLFETELNILELELPEIDFSEFTQYCNAIHLPSYEYVLPPARPLFHIHNEADHTNIAMQYSNIIRQFGI